MQMTNREVLISGKTSFKVEVPYILIETGEKGEPKPLIVYLHGYGQNVEEYKSYFDKCISINAYHLFIQGPYPIYDRSGKKNVSQWGRAWYLYDGNRGQFIKSLELASEFIQEIIDKLIDVINVNRLCISGYSMGGYLAGYFALTRWKHVNELIVIGGRIKSEVLHDNWENVKHLNVLALHGKNDDKVLSEPQQKEIQQMKDKNIHAELILLDENHSLSDKYVTEMKKWLLKNQYKEI